MTRCSRGGRAHRIENIEGSVSVCGSPFCTSASATKRYAALILPLFFLVPSHLPDLFVDPSLNDPCLCLCRRGRMNNSLRTKGACLLGSVG